MKNGMNANRTAWMGLMAAGLLAAVAGTAMGQNADTPRKQPEAVVYGSQQVSGDPTVTLDFPGGTLTEFVDAIRHAAGKEQANIMVSGQVDESPIPAISLTNASLRASLMSLESMAIGPDAMSKVSVKAMNSDSGVPVYSIRISSPPQRAERGQATRVLSLNQLCKPDWAKAGGDGAYLPRETVLSAIETAVNLVAAGSTATQAQIRFHPESGLLIVVGVPDQLNAAEMVIENLTHDVQRMQMEMPSPRSTFQFSPMSVTVQRLAEAVRDALPEGGTQGLGMTTTDQAVIVNGTEADLRAAKAVARLVDRPSPTSPQLIDATVRMEAMAQEMERLRRAVDEREAMLSEMRAQMEASKAQARDAARAMQLLERSKAGAGPGAPSEPK